MLACGREQLPARPGATLGSRLLRFVSAGAVGLVSLGLCGCVEFMGHQIPVPLAALDLVLGDEPTWEERQYEKRRRQARQHADRYAARQRHADRITSALRRYSREGTSRPPVHGSALVASGALKPRDFVAPASRTEPAQIAVGPTNLAALASLPHGERWAAVRAAAEALPDDVVAHRLGDLVFVYHGVKPALAGAPADRARRDTNIWWVVVVPDPRFNGPLERGQYVWLGADQVEAVAYWELVCRSHAGAATSLHRQNSWRRSLGLAPLPDPSTVRHGAPAAAASGSRQAQLVRLDDVGWWDQPAPGDDVPPPHRP